MSLAFASGVLPEQTRGPWHRLRRSSIPGLTRDGSTFTSPGGLTDDAYQAMTKNSCQIRQSTHLYEVKEANDYSLRGSLESSAIFCVLVCSRVSLERSYVGTYIR